MSIESFKEKMLTCYVITVENIETQQISFLNLNFNAVKLSENILGNENTQQQIIRNNCTIRHEGF